MRMMIPIELTQDQVQRLVNLAYACGWAREEPRRRWTEPEQKAAVRHAVSFLVSSATVNKTEER